MGCWIAFHHLSLFHEISSFSKLLDCLFFLMLFKQILPDIQHGFKGEVCTYSLQLLCESDQLSLEFVEVSHPASLEI